ncbi:MAG: hypothetical protein Q8K26_02390, partial [Candidatus Gracilibacteria bacterium]|nr:hypothetical protein [Candidatus Gracilibacteria bacterium]
GIVYALSYPTSVPTGETPGGKFKTYFNNMFTTGCTGTNVVQSIGSDGTLHCVTGGGGGASINYALCQTITFTHPTFAMCPANYVVTGVDTGLRFPGVAANSQIRCCKIQ